MSAVNSPLPVGAMLRDGEYRIKKTLGQGGFGITYLADQPMLKREVAVKEFFMQDYCERDAKTARVRVRSKDYEKQVATFRSKFVKEAQTIASIDNQNVIRIHNIFEENGTAYYVMEYVAGGTLADLVRNRGVLPEDEAVRYACQIADALTDIHGKGILHLDIKPTNILVREDKEDGGKEMILIDFGAAKHYDEEGIEVTMSPVARSSGYAPIEQYESGGMTRFSPATDIYSLGAVLYFMLTGMRPAEATVLLFEKLSFPAHVDGRMRGVISKAMAPDKNDRYQCAWQFKDAIDEKTRIDESDANPERKKTGNDIADYPGTNRGVKTVIPGGSKENNENTPLNNPQKKTALAIIVFVICAAGACFFWNALSGGTMPHGLDGGDSVKKTDPPAGALDLGYGVWDGEVKDGKPDGIGILIYTTSHDMTDLGFMNMTAEPGDKIKGEFVNGKFMGGALYDSEGTKKATRYN